MVYSKWRRYMDSAIELQPVELAGRGARFNVPFCESIEESVEDVFKLIKGKLGDSKYALFGHSMGSLITYELIHKIMEFGFNEPEHVFFSGRFPPHHREAKIYYKLSDEEFKKEVLSHGGTSKEVFENKELADYFIRILRADYKMLDIYQYVQKHNKLNCDISVLHGKEDILTKNKVDEWDRYTNGLCSLYEFEGGHFFINDLMESVIKLINDTLSK